MPAKPEDWDTLFTHDGLSNASLAGVDAPRSPAEPEEHKNCRTPHWAAWGRFITSGGKTDAKGHSWKRPSASGT